MMKKALFAFALITGLFMIVSCGVVKGKKEAEAVAESLFEERINYEEVDTRHFYAESFWELTTEKKWSEITRLVDDAMGKLKSYSLKTWNIQSKVQTGGMSGTVVLLVYETTYEKGKGTETLTIHKPLLSDRFAIVGHRFNSERIHELINKGIEQATSGNTI